MIRNYARLHERLEMRTLDNGLRVCWLPKEGFSKTFAILAADFGSCDQSFTFGGSRYDTPAGIAHFLEHKMFEDKDGNALQKFAKTGASPNAFTSQVMTAYHFACTARFEDNLETLLKFVFTPYFTEENVEKERGIIAQEIGMMDDTPAWRAFSGLFDGLYKEHPVRIPIAGSVNSIAEITPELLYTCHKAFYSPSNMALVVCGPADFDAICSIAESHSPDNPPSAPIRHYGVRQGTVNKALETHQMHVSEKQFLLGFKDEPVGVGESRLRRAFLGDLAARMLCGDTSPLYAQLYDNRLVKSDFDTDYTIIPDGAQAVLGGESRDPYAVRGAIESEVSRLARDGVDEALFSRMKKAMYGMYLRAIESPESCGRREISALFGNEHCPDFAELSDTITPDDVRLMYVRWARDGCSSMSAVEPLD